MTGKPQGIKVPDELLAKSAKMINLKSRIRGCKGIESADLVEALVAAAWLSNVISLNELVLKLTRGVDVLMLLYHNMQEDVFVKNLASILDEIVEEVDIDLCAEDFILHLRRKLES